MKKNTNGFTLAELLIVVAIIAVLVAISIPIFTSQLEKSRQSVDLDTVRAAYSTVKYAEMLGEGPNGEKNFSTGTHYSYYLKSDGTFKECSEGFAGSDAYAMKSHNADISQWAKIHVDDLKDAHLYLYITYDGDNLLYTMDCF